MKIRLSVYATIFSFCCFTLNTVAEGDPWRSTQTSLKPNDEKVICADHMVSIGSLCLEVCPRGFTGVTIDLNKLAFGCTPTTLIGTQPSVVPTSCAQPTCVQGSTLGVDSNGCPICIPPSPGTPPLVAYEAEQDLVSSSASIGKGGPTITCQNVLCIQGTHCEMNGGTASCESDGPGAITPVDPQEFLTDYEEEGEEYCPEVRCPLGASIVEDGEGCDICTGGGATHDCSDTVCIKGSCKMINGAPSCVEDFPGNNLDPVKKHKKKKKKNKNKKKAEKRNKN